MDNFFEESITSRPSISWTDIKDKCRPIGEQGYYADCYYWQELDLVVKKYRLATNYRRVVKEIKVLMHLQHLEQNIVRHRLVQDGLLIGFTLPFYKGKVWDHYLINQDSIFRRSSVARVKLVLQIWQLVKQLQQIQVCHGDIHFQNILIEADEAKQSMVDPNFRVKLIDYGNAFLMIPGQVVSEGLNGWSPLIPPEAEFSFKKDYDPSGVNAYQLARICLFILLQDKFSTIQQKSYSPLAQLNRLKTLEQYPVQLYELIKQLVHYSISKRVEALFKDWSPLQMKTKEIFIKLQKVKQKLQT